MPSDYLQANQLGKQRLRIGLLGDPMHSEQSFWLGVADAAEVHEVNLYVFLGGAVMTSELKHTVRYGLIGIESAVVLYDLVDVERMDGLITWAGSGAGLGIHLNDEEMSAFFQRYHPLPIVNYEKVVEGIPSVLTDTAQDMCELLIHMIETHGARRIALLRGPHNHFESNERTRAYNETLAKYGLPIDPNLICTATGWDLRQGRDMMRVLLNERGLRAGIDFDSVVGTEGQFTGSAVQELKAQGVRVPEEVIVAGYNDFAEARAIIPSITIMRKAFYDAGWKSLETLLELIQGKPVPEQVIIPSELVIRRSCGCWTPTVQQLNAQKPLDSLYSQHSAPVAADSSLKATLAAHQDEILAAVIPIIRDLVPTESAHPLASTLTHALFTDITHDTDSRYIFITALESALRVVPLRIRYIKQWHAVISTLRCYVTPYLVDDHDRWFQVENLWQQSHIIIQLEAERIELERNLDTLSLTLNLRETDRQLMAALNMQALLDAIAHELPKLGIPAFYMSLYENPQPYAYPQPVSEWSRLVLGFNEHGRINLPPDGQKFLSRRLIPDDVSLSDKATSWIVVPLYREQQQFGFVLLEAGPKNGMLYAELWQLISNALQVASLMNERVKLAMERERVAILADFIRDVGHEFRTPLSNINTRIYLLDKQFDSEKRIRYMETLKSESIYIQTLVDSMLTMARLDSKDEFAFAPFNVADLLRELENKMRSMIDAKQITFRVEVADDLTSIQGDRKELFGALLHIVENAIQYTPTGGTNNVRAYTSADSVIIEIADTGIGINEGDLSRIFERFYRVDRVRTGRGAGLGLSIVKKIVDVHRGSIKVVSTPGQGSIFKVILPHSAG